MALVWQTISQIVLDGARGAVMIEMQLDDTDPDSDIMAIRWSNTTLNAAHFKILDTTGDLAAERDISAGGTGSTDFDEAFWFRRSGSWSVKLSLES